MRQRITKAQGHVKAVMDVLLLADCRREVRQVFGTRSLLPVSFFPVTLVRGAICHFVLHVMVGESFMHMPLRVAGRDGASQVVNKGMGALFGPSDITG